MGASDGRGEDGVASRHRVMRRLIELPACLYDDLTEADRAYLANQRARLAEWCREMTGWVVEQRAEGMALIASDEEDTDLPFPRMRALDFATLILLNELRSVIDEQREVGDGEVLAAAGRIRERYPKALTKELDTDQAIKEQSVQLLSALDLIRLVPTSAGQRWWLSPVAERFRDPEVVAVSSRLDSEEELEQ